MTTKADTAAARHASTDTRGAVSPRLVVWVELPQPEPPGGQRGPLRGPVYDPSALYEECERWDGMA